MAEHLEYGDQTMLVWSGAVEHGEAFDPAEAAAFLCGVREENSSAWQLMRKCFPRELWLEAADTPAGREDKIGRQRAYLKGEADKRGVKLPGRVLYQWFKAGGEEGVDLQSNRSGSLTSGGKSAGLPVRQNLYKLCAALGFDAAQTREFFAKTTFLSAFNNKVWEELCYSYFIARGERDWYARGSALIGEIGRTAGAPAVPTAVRQTRQVEQDVSALADAGELKRYILDHLDTFRPENLYYTARREIAGLYQKCMPYAIGERAGLDLRLTERTSSDLLHRSLDETVDEFDGLTVREFYLVLLGGREYERYRIDGEDEDFVVRILSEELHKVKESPLLAGVRMNCAEELEALEGIVGGEKRPEDEVTLRHLVLTLGFYLFFAQCRHARLFGADRPDPREGFNSLWNEERELDYSAYGREFRSHMDDLLNRAGMVPLYPGSSFDSLYLLAAATARPLDTLRELVNLKLEG